MSKPSGAIDMTQGKPINLMLRFALPMMIGSIFQSLYSMVDSAVLGRFVGWQMAEQAGVAEGYFGIVLKVIGIAYLSQFASQLCADAGEGAVAAKIELAGKVLIMAISIPVLTEVLHVVLTLV